MHPQVHAMSVLLSGLQPVPTACWTCGEPLDPESEPRDRVIVQMGVVCGACEEGE